MKLILCFLLVFSSSLVRADEGSALPKSKKKPASEESEIRLKTELLPEASSRRQGAMGGVRFDNKTGSVVNPGARLEPEPKKVNNQYDDLLPGP